MKETERMVHLSIDDIGKSMRWLSINKPDSIFDMRLFGQLKKWHDIYNAKFSLYCFVIEGNFSITEIPRNYSNEFMTNAEWLRFGFHGKNNRPFREEREYESAYRMFITAADNAGMHITNTIRLHNWLATDLQKKYLYSQGIRALLYPAERYCPNSADDVFFEFGIEHWKTHVRFEQLETVSPKALFIGKSRIVGFTHEKEFEKESGKIEKALYMFCENGYSFI